MTVRETDGGSQDAAHGGASAAPAERAEAGGATASQTNIVLSDQTVMDLGLLFKLLIHSSNLMRESNRNRRWDAAQGRVDFLLSAAAHDLAAARLAFAGTVAGGVVGFGAAGFGVSSSRKAYRMSTGTAPARGSGDGGGGVGGGASSGGTAPAFLQSAKAKFDRAATMLRPDAGRRSGGDDAGKGTSASRERNEPGEEAPSRADPEPRLVHTAAGAKSDTGRAVSEGGRSVSMVLEGAGSLVSAEETSEGDRDRAWAEWLSATTEELSELIAENGELSQRARDAWQSLNQGRHDTTVRVIGS